MMRPTTAAHSSLISPAASSLPPLLLPLLLLLLNPGVRAQGDAAAAAATTPALVVQGRTCPVYPRLAGSGGANRTDFPRRPLHLCFDGNKIAPALQVLGCMKCGTSSLHYELTKRVTRDITQGKVLAGEFWFTKKEKHFFDRDETFKKGMGWYVNHYPRCVAEAPIVGVDSTQGYLKVGSVAQRMFESYTPEHAATLRFVIMLRDPVPRLFSNYHHRNICCNPEKLSFEQWTERQIQQTRQCMAAGGDAAKSLWPDCGEEGIFAGFYGLQLQVRKEGGEESKGGGACSLARSLRRFCPPIYEKI